ncbi:MAG: ATP-binding protein [Myxococcaceae bacterium]
MPIEQLRELIDERDRSAFDEWLLLPEAAPDLDVRIRNDAGLERWTTVRRSAHGEVLTRDIDQRKRAELALFDSEDRFDAFMQATAAAAWMKDEAGRFVWVNRAWEGLSDKTRAQMIGHTTLELFGEAASAAIERADAQVLVDGRAHFTLDTFPNGQCFQTVRFLFWDHSGARFLGGMAFDVTSERKAARELEQLQERLRLTQKMEAIGRLAQGVAHDFNNLIAVINACASTLRYRADNPELEQISLACDRAATLIGQLLSFSRGDKAKTRPLSLAKELAAIAPLAQRLAHPPVTFTTQIAPDLPDVLADPGELSQVVLNLVANARDAIATHGKIVLGARRNAEGHAVLFITDDGTGMDEATRQRALEPFFTTKEPGKGTGLGLSTVFGIVTGWGASVSIDSALGRGTTVSIELKSAVDTRPAKAQLMLVDDDDLVRKATRVMLEHQGHQVVALGSGADALAALQRGAPCELLITDVRMPEMTGNELAERALALRPELRILAISGHTDEVSVGPLILPLLTKPFSYDDLDFRVRELLRR